MSRVSDIRGPRPEWRPLEQCPEWPRSRKPAAQTRSSRLHRTRIWLGHNRHHGYGGLARSASWAADECAGDRIDGARLPTGQGLPARRVSARDPAALRQAEQARPLGVGADRVGPDDRVLLLDAVVDRLNAYRHRTARQLRG